MADKAERAMSFGTIAEDYDRYRPGPTAEVVDWLLPAGATSVADLGAGTGALTRLLVVRVQHVFSIEPDDRMRAVLSEHSPTATALKGRGDAIPLEDGSVDAVLVASAWHWMDVEPTLAEIARVLRPPGRLGVVWAGPDRRVPWLATFLGRARQAGLAENLVEGLTMIGDSGPGAGEVATAAERHRFFLPEASPFTPPEFAEFNWTRTMTIDDLVGLAGTYSAVITLTDTERRQALRLARAWLESQPELSESGQIELPFRAGCWRTDHDFRRGGVTG
jgi:SAM-dependent methyltransferase